MSDRRYEDFKGVEPLVDNILGIVRDNIEDELQKIADETGDDALPVFAEYLLAEKATPTFPVIVVQPDEDGALENEERVDLNEAYQLDITIVAQPSDDLEQLTRDIMRYKRAVMQVLWSASESEVFANMMHETGSWELRGGRYTWVQVGGIYARAVKNMKLVAAYQIRGE